MPFGFEPGPTVCRRTQRLLAIALVLILGVACSGEGGQQAGERTSSSSTEVPGHTSVAAEDCDLAVVPPGGEITFVDAGRLYGVSGRSAQRRCLASHATGLPQWNGTGTKVIFDAEEVLSRPEGKSVLRIDDGGRLFKRPVEGSEELDISFIRHDEVLYHPAGRHIASVGRDAAGVYGIFVATNQGADSRLVTRGEEASLISHLAWTESGVLAFSAVHGGRSHVHRLDLASLELSTVAEAADPVSDVAASRFEGAGLAWATSSGSSCSLSREPWRPDHPGSRLGPWHPPGRMVAQRHAGGAVLPGGPDD